MLFGGWIVLLFASPGLARVDWNSVGASTTLAALYSTLFATAFAYLAWQRGVSRIGANRVLVYQYLITLVGVLSGAVLLGENLGADKLLGGAIILVGVYLARRQ